MAEAMAYERPSLYVNEPERYYYNGTKYTFSDNQIEKDKEVFRNFVSKFNTHRIYIRGYFRLINDHIIEDDGTYGDDPLEAANDILNDYQNRQTDSRIILSALTQRCPNRDVGTAAARIIFDAWIKRGNETDMNVWHELHMRCGAY